MRNGLLLLIAFFSLTVRAEEFSVDEVQVAGNLRIDTAAIRQQLKKTSGAISQPDISDDVKSLYRTGFFDQVTAAIVRLPGPPAKTVLKYTVSEKPTVRKVFIKGNEAIDNKELSGIFTFDVRRFLDKATINGLIKKAVEEYRSKGYADASIVYSVLSVGDNQVDITFNVTEGERYRIRDIRFAGLQTLDEGELKSAIQTRRYKWWSSWLFGTGRLNNEMLENDRSLIRQYFLDHGLVDGSVSEPVIEKEEGGFVVTFELNEGQPYHIGRVTASGDLLSGGSAETLEGVKIERGNLFKASQVREDAFAISDKFANIGYAFANVVPNTSLDRTAKLVNVDYAITKGRLVSINRINIKGNEKTYDHVIRRELVIDEGDLYSGKKVKRSQDLLQRLGYFEESNISTSPVSDDKVDLNVNVREGSTGTLSAGAGYSTSDGLLFNTRISENNLFGTGRRAVLDLNFGTQRDSYVFSLEDRRLFDTYVAGGFDLMRTDREYRDFDRHLTGGGMSLGYPLEHVFGEWAEDISASLRYEYLDIDITNVDPEEAPPLVLESQGKSTASGITPRIVRNTINNPLNPTRGSRQEISVELTGLGGNQEFYLIEARNSFYEPLTQGEWGDLTLSMRTSFGYGKSLNDEDFPLYRRFFPGGINSVRGFKSRTLGPKDENGRQYGGSKELINNIDVLFPLINSIGLKGVVFFDLGQAYDDDEPIDLGLLRQAYGAGVRWSSPIGPMRVEFGFPLDREEGESNMVTMFSFGAPL